MVCLSMLSLKQFIIKQLLVSDFVISRLIKVSVSVISLRPRLGWSLVCYILWVLTTSKKSIGILNLKPWTEFDFTPPNRYLRRQLSFISEETLIVSSVTLPSPLEMLYNPVNLACGTNVGGSLIFLERLFCFCFVYYHCHHHCQHYHYHYHCHHHYTIYFCVLQEVVFNRNFRVNLHVEIQVKNKQKKEINKNKDRNWIGNLRVAPILSVKAKLSAKLLVWKIFYIRLIQTKHIYTGEILHLPSFWKWEFL